MRTRVRQLCSVLIVAASAVTFILSSNIFVFGNILLLLLFCLVTFNPVVNV